MAANRVRLKDIADAYHCSINTVSKALRDSDKLPESTKQNIKKLAEEMGYIENRQASGLRSGFSHTVAVIVNDIRNIYFSNIINEIEILLRKCGYDLMIFCTQTDVSEEERSVDVIRTALAQSVDGILYFPYWNDLEAVEYLEKSRIPFVLVDNRVMNVEAEAVYCDNYQFGALAAEHLLCLGYQAFSYASGITNSSANNDRQQGFVDTLLKNGISEEKINLIQWEIVEKAKETNNYADFLKPSEFPAVFAYNDDIAYRIIKSLRGIGLHAPEDYSIIGCDHLAAHLRYLEDLTSISWDDTVISIAQASVETLCRRIQQPDSPKEVHYLSAKLYNGNTTGSQKTNG